MLLRLWKAPPQNPFTTVLRDVKKDLARGQRVTDCPRSDWGAPCPRSAAWIPHKQNITLRFCADVDTSPQNFRFWFSPQNRSNNLSILPDLQSNRISIHSPIISSDILGRSSALQEILSLVYHLKNFFRHCAFLVSGLSKIRIHKHV